MGGFFSIPSWNDVDTPANPKAAPVAPKGGRRGRTYKKRKNQRSKTRK